MLWATWKLEIKAHGAAMRVVRLWWTILQCVAELSHYSSIDQ